MAAEKRIRVMIVEDHFMVRMGLAAIVKSQPDMVTVAEAKDGPEAIALFHKQRPDVTLMDLLLPGIDGVQAISEIMKQQPAAKIIVVSAHGGDEDIYRAMQAGARAYYLKHVEGQELVAGIRAVHAGESPLAPEIAARLVERMRRAALSPREMEVFRLMAHGTTNKEIGSALSISERTVRVHISHLLMKLGCHDKTQAVSEAYRRGILHVGEAPKKI
ncbi:MAG: response regulator transcription factor [Vicinamibacteria bacterium]|nr:response regulator transcription factor [Vicinamibacteria bacterium]